ncbi:MAG TPA: hypothetical protein VHU92_26605 [Streptosporangiaceae bacterium]|nr:hypothetical protein [Streptosporangiaceae bacterium]
MPQHLFGRSARRRPVHGLVHRPAGGDVTLRTSATDAAGGSVTETIQDAYRS